MEFKDYYHILGLAPDADDKAIKTAYRKLARKYHPDVSSDDNAEQKFKEVAEAYHVLKDPEKRAEYDQLRRYRQSGGDFEPPPGWQSAAGRGSAEGFGGGFTGGFSGDFGDQSDFSDFFESLFGGRGGARGFSWSSGGQGGSARGGQDLEVEMPLFLEDTVAETAKQIRLNVPQYDERGRRLPDREKTLNVKIPAGTGDNERIRLKGQGAPGIGGGPAGDLFLRVRLVPHPLFDVDGRDLIVTVPVAPWEAALGGKIEVPTLTGRISLTIPADSQTGKRLRIKGRGLSAKGQNAGDLYAVLKVVMPPTATDEQKNLWKKLAASSGFDPRADWER